MKSIYLIIVLLVAAIHAKSQDSSALEKYIRLGLENNLALKQKQLNLEKSLLALKEANSLFYPSIHLSSQYTLSSGGRSIDLPIGDLLNPVYSSLNQLTGEPGAFPAIANQEIQFLPNNYHDTKFRVIMPLVNAEIYYNRKIKNEMIGYSQAELNVYKRELVKEIKVAYLRFLQSVKVIEAYKSASALLTEALHVNEKLVKNQMAGNDKVLRIKAELSQVEAQVTKAENDKRIASSFFNFLVNQPLNSNLEVDSVYFNAEEREISGSPLLKTSREELDQLRSSAEATGYLLHMKRATWVPTISNVTDLGYQGFEYTFDSQQQYVMNVIELKWNIFSGFQNQRQISQVKIDLDALENKYAETEHQIELQQQMGVNNYNSSLVAEKASYSSLVSSQEYYKIVSRQYGEGQKSLLDLIDARNQLTSSHINYSVAHFETLIKMAELERAFASYNILQN